jgi:hypothetical protein
MGNDLNKTEIRIREIEEDLCGKCMKKGCTNDADYKVLSQIKRPLHKTYPNSGKLFSYICENHFQSDPPLIMTREEAEYRVEDHNAFNTEIIAFTHLREELIELKRPKIEEIQN